MAVPTTLANRLRALRARLDLTQEQLATRADISVATIVEIEAGRRRRLHARTAGRLAAALGVPVGELFAEASESVS